MKNKRLKNILLIFFTICILFVVINYLSIKRYNITTPLQDRFYMTKKVINSVPDPTFDVKIYDYVNKRKKLILYIHNMEDLEVEKISVLYSNNYIKCYIYSNYIIYKNKESDGFTSLYIQKFEHMEPKKYKYLIPIANEILKSNWGLSKSVSEFLIKSKDTQALNVIKRYAKGIFTKEELKNNLDPEITEMQKYCRSLLNKYDIKN